MCAPFLTTPLLLALLSSTPAIAQPTSEEWDTAGDRNLELRADDAGQVSEMRIGPGQVSTLEFNTRLLQGGVVVEGREHFRSVMVDEAAGVVTLLPSDTVPRDRPLTVTVQFADEDLPRSATFRLVVHPARAERQVRVYRRPRSGESYQQESRQERERADRCEAQLTQTRAEQQHPDGLTGLIDIGLMAGNEGVRAQEISESIHQRPGETLQVFRANSYHAKERVAVELNVGNTGTAPWTVEWAELVGRNGKRLRIISVWPLKPIPPGEPLRLVVEAEATEEQARDTFILKLWEANGPRTITLRGVTFP
ncbi:DUF2381 family protein [Vitiosangium sp. GDMCC 1.1324]|uniref:DUF2381 family protein n=1 Tax=Vitiosangium sp. (strain GDMCC 1.1324) TaxID=2138576 RepID=UPI000D36E448|nr:DUF2381 family protein [Vitiosangium sp. GDMCC 1.1324]PTL84135.1 hypothetical protein DAT35_11885 [Vitiosangium sp. GDMCC 1.1324]